MKPQAQSRPLRTRRIHYVAGFDPRGAAHYHRLCRDEAAKPQPQGGTLAVGARERLSAQMHRWQVRWRGPDGQSAEVATEHVFMCWDDIVRAHWSRGPLALMRDFASTYSHMILRIGVVRVGRMYSPVCIAGMLPFFIVLVSVLLTAGIGLAWGAVAALAVAAVVLPLWWLAARSGLLWMLRILTFYTRMAHGPVPGHAQRTAEWVEAIVDRQQREPVDEVLLVGHSVGVAVMVEAVDALLADARWQALQAGRSTAWLSLGQSLPIVTLAPGSQSLRESLARLCVHQGLRWWDVTARIDPLCCYQLPPLAGSEPDAGTLPWPKRHAARFMHMYEAESWRRIRLDKVRAHFLYLMTPQKRGNFSPFDVMYGPRSLSQQMAERPAADHPAS